MVAEEVQALKNDVRRLKTQLRALGSRTNHSMAQEIQAHVADLKNLMDTVWETSEKTRKAWNDKAKHMNAIMESLGVDPEGDVESVSAQVTSSMKQHGVEAESGTDKHQMDRTVAPPKTEKEREALLQRVREFVVDPDSFVDVRDGLESVFEDPTTTTTGSATGQASTKSRMRDLVVTPALQHWNCVRRGVRNLMASSKPDLHIMYGPPGSGKTHMMRASARAVWNAMRAGGVEAGSGILVLFLKRSMLTPKWEGAATRQLHELFLCATYPPKRYSVVFLYMDEADSLVDAHVEDDTTKQLSNELAKGLDTPFTTNPDTGFAPRVVVLFGTNEFERINAKIKSRADSKLFFPPMNRSMAKEILHNLWSKELARVARVEYPSPAVRAMLCDTDVDVDVDVDVDGDTSIGRYFVTPSAMKVCLDCLFGSASQCDVRPLVHLVKHTFRSKLAMLDPEAYADLMATWDKGVVPRAMVPCVQDLVHTFRDFAAKQQHTRKLSRGIATTLYHQPSASGKRRRGHHGDPRLGSEPRSKSKSKSEAKPGSRPQPRPRPRSGHGSGSGSGHGHGSKHYGRKRQRTRRFPKPPGSSSFSKSVADALDINTDTDADANWQSTRENAHQWRAYCRRRKQRQRQRTRQTTPGWVGGSK